MKAPLPENEAARLDALRSYRILDTLPEASYDDITHLASVLCEAPIALVSLVDSDRQWFKSRHGLEATETPRHVAFCAHAILQSELMVVPDTRADERFADNPLVTSAPNIRFYAGAQLVTGKGEALGTLCVIDQVQRTLSDAQADALRALSRQVMAQLELRRHIAEQQRYRRMLEAYHRELEDSNARLEAQSLTDDVTGFHNTRFLHHYLDDQLALATARGEALSLVFFDMDGFKAVVDAHGHLLGARVLREVAAAVHRMLDRDDRIVRYGGDEYVVILPGQARDQALAKAERIRDVIGSTAFLLSEELDVRVTASLGVATFPDDARDKRQLLMEADHCLFQSKRDGKNRVSRKTGGG